MDFLQDAGSVQIGIVSEEYGRPLTAPHQRVLS